MQHLLATVQDFFKTAVALLLVYLYLLWQLSFMQI